jgi:hypothetical protein
VRSPKKVWEIPALVLFGALLVWGALTLVRVTGRGGVLEDAGRAPEVDAGMPPELSSSLSDIRDRRLSLGAPAWRTQRLAIGKGRLVWLGKADYLSLALPGFEGATHPLERPRATLEVPGGSIVIVSERRTLRLDPGAKEATVLARTPFLPGSELVPELRNSKKFWVRQRATHALVRYELALGEHLLLPNEGVIELPENAGGAFTTLRDGSWIYATSEGLEARVPEGKARRFALEAAERPWRLLPGPRIDEVWAITPDGRVRLYRVLDRLYRVLELENGQVPFDAAASEGRLALLGVVEGKGRREFGLKVFDKSGKLELYLELGGDRAAPSEDWAARVLDREVALHDEPPLVAVSDPEGLRVFEVGTGRLAYRARSPGDPASPAQ